ncbi:Xylose isomerase-like protein [Mycena sanguinolenta]|uniref:Xylose isomerase-like protein n=1 Tax=Mycena sanguinolenta TaxID=230812 RepID=A0A8H7DKI9_9AGAR|nr:Xylose isomerase-like protein [Mycena sanguinolenta]
MAPKFAIASLSLGNCAHHNLPTKIRTAASLGYDGIEIFIPDFDAFVREVEQGLHRDLFPDAKLPAKDALEVECAKAIGGLCESLNIAIPVLQPLRGFENFASSSCLGGGGLSAALEAAERWLRLMPHLKTRLLLVCSNFIEPEDHPFAPFDPAKEPLSSLSGSMGPQTTPPGPAPSPFLPSPMQEQLSAYLDAQVEAFTALGKIAARYGVRIGYEALAWGTVVDNWEQVWDVVRRVGRENVGIILDSFNYLGNQYADPMVSPTFLRNATSCSQTPIPSLIPLVPPLPHGVPLRHPHSLMAHLQPQNATHKAVLQNLALLAQTVPAHKVFLYQVADAGPPCTPPATIEPAPHTPARMIWSRAARLFPCEDTRGAWLPVVDMSVAVVEAGYPAAANYACGDEDDAWWSLEVFNNSLMDPRPECVQEHGARGLVGLRTLWDRVSERIQEAEDLSAASPLPSPTSSDESYRSDDSVRGRHVRSDTDTSEEVPSCSKAVNDCQPME